MSIETAVRASKELEGLLESGAGASGKGLHEKLSSVEGQIPAPLARKLRRIATIRNKAVHEAEYEIENPQAFAALCAEATTELRAHVADLRQRKASKVSADTERYAEASAKQPGANPPKHQLAMALAFAVAVVGGAIYLRSGSLPGSRKNQTYGQAGGQVIDTTATPLQSNSEPQVSTTPRILQRAKVEGHEESKKPLRIASRHEHPIKNVDDASYGEPGMQAAEAGDGVALRRNQAVDLRRAVMTKGPDSFGSPVWKLKAKVVNTTSKYLESIDAKAMVFLPGRPQPIGPIAVPIYFDSQGLAPGSSYSVNQQLGGNFGSYALQTPDVLNSKTLGVILTVSTVDDGLGKTYAPDSRHLYAKAAPMAATSSPAEGGALGLATGFSLASNGVIAITHASLDKEPGAFGGKRWVLHGTVRNLTNGYLESVATEARVSVPGDASRLDGVRQTIYFGSAGLAAGQKTDIDLRLGGTFNDRLGVPDVENATSIGVELRVISAIDGMGREVAAAR